MDSGKASDLPGAPTELADLQRRLAWAEQLLASFQHALGHELPNQLVALQGLVRILELDEGEHLGPASRDYLRRLTGVTQRVHAQVSLLAEICRARQDPSPPEAVDVQEAAREAAAEVNQLFPGRTIEYHFPGPAFVWTVSRPALRRVLFQLLRNAVQAGPERQPVSVEVGTRQTPSQQEFWVADQGRGVSAEQLLRLQAFLAGRDGTPPGGGLGLVLVRALVGRWGGSVRVDSAPGQGTVFTVSLEIPGAERSGMGGVPTP